jgi:crossover junction endodeoxyribonuclease RuvC
LHFLESWLPFSKIIRRTEESRFLRLSVHTPDSIILTKEKIILGIDPGTNILGFGIIRVDSKGPHYVDMGVFDLRKIKDPFEKLANIYAGVNELIEEHKPDELAVESPFYGKNAQVVLKLGRAQGAAITAAIMHGLSVAEYAPRKAKIAICGNGAASKEQVAMMIQKTLKVELDPKYLDATDALAIALCHHYQMSSPLVGVGGKSDWKKFLENNPDRVKK